MLKFIVFSSFAFAQEIDENFDLFRNMFETSGPGSDRKIGEFLPLFLRDIFFSGKYFPIPTQEAEVTAPAVEFSGLRCWKCDHDSIADCQGIFRV